MASPRRAPSHTAPAAPRRRRRTAPTAGRARLRSAEPDCQGLTHTELTHRAYTQGLHTGLTHRAYTQSLHTELTYRVYMAYMADSLRQHRIGVPRKGRARPPRGSETPLAPPELAAPELAAVRAVRAAAAARLGPRRCRSVARRVYAPGQHTCGAGLCASWILRQLQQGRHDRGEAGAKVGAGAGAQARARVRCAGGRRRG